jgi:nitrate reductase (NAD(P)H)
VKRGKKQDEEKVKEQQGGNDSTDGAQQEHEWWRGSDDDKHNDAYATDQKDSDTSDKQEEDKSTQQQVQDESQDQTLEDKYSPQELALLRSLDHESKHVCCLGMNDGTGKSPQTQNLTQISMDEKDQFSPDNWIPRSSKLIRRTGKCPLNAEPGLNNLYDAGLITPTELYYVRNHGAVPRLLWEFHKLHVGYDGRGKTFSTTDLASFDIINIPILRFCDAECRLTRPDSGYVEDDNMFGF